MFHRKSTQDLARSGVQACEETADLVAKVRESSEELRRSNLLSRRRLNLTIEKSRLKGTVLKISKQNVG